MKTIKLRLKLAGLHFQSYLLIVLFPIIALLVDHGVLANTIQNLIDEMEGTMNAIEK